MSNTTRLLTLGIVGLLALSLVAGAGAFASTNNGAAPQTQDRTASVSASPNTPGSTATHTATVTVGSDASGSSWNSLVLDYSESDLSNVGQGDLTVVGIDRGDDDSGTTVDVDVSDDVSSVSASDDGTTLTIGLGGNYDLEQGDQLVVQFEDATNPKQTGNYTVQLTVNQQSAAETTDATLTIEESSDDGTSDDNTTDDNTTDDNESSSAPNTTDCGCENATADITFDRQTSDGETVTVDSVTLSAGGFVVVTDANGNVVGTSEYLTAGTHEDVTITLDDPVSSDTTLTGTVYQDADDDETFDSDDCPYTEDGSDVSDDACIELQDCAQASSKE